MLRIAEVFPLKLELCSVGGANPFVIEVHYIAVGTVIDRQRNDLASAVLKFMGKFKDITDSSTSETV